MVATGLGSTRSLAQLIPHGLLQMVRETCEFLDYFLGSGSKGQGFSGFQRIFKPMVIKTFYMPCPYNKAPSIRPQNEQIHTDPLRLAGVVFFLSTLRWLIVMAPHLEHGKN
jgi:hypothetical protein